MPLAIARLDASAPDFAERLQAALAWSAPEDQAVQEAVRKILADVKARKDEALIHWTKELDGFEVGGMEQLLIPRERLQASLERLPAEQAEALRTAAGRIRRYHEKQKPESWEYQDPDGSTFGQKVSAIERVGLYVPGGKAAYPSTVLMSAMPARVAGVGEIVAAMPQPGGEINELALAALALAEADHVFAIGGAQAIAAMAYGTASVPKVNKIIGPGNVYVAAAKKQVFGEVGIDMVAGPSEILVICDGSADPDWIAMDLLSQAEHDEDAQAILVSPDADFIRRVEDSLNRLLPALPRRKIIRASLEARGLLIQTSDLEQGAEVCNLIAPEHVELAVENPRKLLAGIRHAGAVFLGSHTSESLGDYCAGPSHVLPTAGTAAFASGLSVHDFQKRSSIIHCSEEAARKLAGTASTLAAAEGLEAHARAAELRRLPGSS